MTSRCCDYCGHVIQKDRPSCTHCGSALSSLATPGHDGETLADKRDGVFSRRSLRRIWNLFVAVEVCQLLGKSAVLAGIIMAAVMDWLNWHYAIGFLAGFFSIYLIMLGMFSRESKDLLLARVDGASSPGQGRLSQELETDAQA
jgi:hypothetical protein